MAKTEVRSAQIKDGTGVDLTVDVFGTLPTVNGGTGLSSPGTVGNILVSNGTLWVSQGNPGAVVVAVAQQVSTIVTTPQVMASYSIAAGSAVPGTTYRIKITGTGDNTAASPTFAFSLRLAGVARAMATIPSVTAAGTGKAFAVEALLVFRSPTSVVGTVSAINELATAFTGAVNIDSPVVNATAVSTTAALSLDLAFSLGAATAGNLIRVETAIIELVKV